jgi:hypothetical protein
VREFSTRMVWAGDHCDVTLTQVADGRARLLANIPLDEWISLGATQYVLELLTDMTMRAFVLDALKATRPMRALISWIAAISVSGAAFASVIAPGPAWASSIVTG